MNLAALSVVVAVLPVLNGVRRWRLLSTGQRYLLAFMTLGFAIGVTGVAMASQAHPTVVFYLFCFLPFAWLCFEAMGRLAGSSRILFLMRAVAVLYTVFWTYCISRLEDGQGFSSHAGPALWLLLTIGAVLLIVQRFRSGVDRPLHDPGVLAGIATAISNAPTAVLEPVSRSLMPAHLDLVVILWNSHAVITIVGYVIYALALEWTAPQSS